jgi:hypothetical protein
MSKLAFKGRGEHFNECVRSLSDEIMRLTHQVERSGIAACALVDVLAFTIANYYPDTREALHLVAVELERLVEEHRRAQARAAAATKQKGADQ